MDRIIITNSLSVLPLETVIAEYESFLKGANGHTLKAKFKYDLPYFLEFLKHQKHIKAPGLIDLTQGMIQEFIDFRLTFEHPRTVHRRGASLKSFCTYIAQQHPGWIDPTYKLRLPQFDALPPKRLSPEQIDSIKAGAIALGGNSAFKRARNLLIIELCGVHGLRNNEVRVLRWDHISEDWKWIIKAGGKARHYRSIPLRQSAQEALKDYLPLWEAKMKKIYRLWRSASNDFKRQVPIILSGYTPNEHRPEAYCVANKTIWKVVSGAGKLAGIENVYPHLCTR